MNRGADYSELLQSTQLKAKEIQQQNKQKYDRYIESQRKRETAEKGEHKFWDTQLVPKFSERIIESGPVAKHEEVDPSWYTTRPYNLPEGYEWCTIEIQDPAQLDEMHALLAEYYVEDDMNRFSKETLLWALSPPNYWPELIVGVRSTTLNVLVATITGTPIISRIYDAEVPMVEINFLCINKLLRSKRLSPVLIKEVSRRVGLRGRFQAIYSSVGPKMPTPVSSLSYLHRILNTKKLIEIGWWTLPQRSTMATEMKKYKLPQAPTHKFVLMQLEDVPQVYALIMESLSNCKLAPLFTIEELAHFLCPKPNVVSTFVLRSSDGAVTDVFSYYAVPCTVIGNEKHNILTSAYKLYSAATSMSYSELLLDAAIIAKNEGYDILSFTDSNDCAQLEDSLNIVKGEGFLHYYLYNWRCPPIQPKDVGLQFL